jgi:hypothetical protein
VGVGYGDIMVEGRKEEELCVDEGGVMRLVLDSHIQRKKEDFKLETNSKQ